MTTKAKKGFTLIELMVVIVIIGILATLGLVSFQNALRRSRDSKAIGDLKDIAVAQEQFKALQGISGSYSSIGTSGATCTGTIDASGEAFAVPTSTSGNNYACYTGGSEFCISVLLEGNNNGNCTSCSCSASGCSIVNAGNANTHFCVASKQ